MRSDLTADDGMSLVELVVGLVIASALALSIAGLLSFSIQARDRVEHAGQVAARLVDLKIAAGLLSQLVPITTVAASATRTSTGLRLTFATSGRAPTSVLVRMTRGDDALPGSVLLFQDDRGREIGPLSLSAFDRASLELLVWRAGRLAWLSDDVAADRPVLGVRILLDDALRQWPVLLWAARPGQTS